MTTKTATLLPDEVAHTAEGIPFVTESSVYKLDPPLMIPNGIADHVVASTLDETLLTAQGFGRSRETHLYVSNDEGMVVDWTVLPSSGPDLDHAGVLALIGYTIAAPIGADA